MTWRWSCAARSPSRRWIDCGACVAECPVAAMYLTTTCPPSIAPTSTATRSSPALGLRLRSVDDYPALGHPQLAVELPQKRQPDEPVNAPALG